MYGRSLDNCPRCEEKPTDLPKKATLPSVQTDTMSIAEEDYNTAARWEEDTAAWGNYSLLQRFHHELHQNEQKQQLQV